MAQCSVDDCTKEAAQMGWCWMHYGRWRRHGDPDIGARKPSEAHEYLERTVYPFAGDDCLPWPFRRLRQGYAVIDVNGRAAMVQRLVCTKIYGPPPSPEHEAAHSCGKGHEGCVNPKHLRWATPKENSADQFLHGTKGIDYRKRRSFIRAGHKKLTPAQVEAIASDSRMRKDIAAAYGVCGHTIRKVKSGKY